MSSGKWIKPAAKPRPADKPNLADKRRRPDFGPRVLLLASLALATLFALAAAAILPGWGRAALVSGTLLAGGFLLAAATARPRKPLDGVLNYRDVAGALVMVGFALVILGDGANLIPPNPSNPTLVESSSP